MVDLRNAARSDLEAVTSLLREAGLPTRGVEDQFPAQYKVATVEGSVVGVAGLELHGRAGYCVHWQCARRSAAPASEPPWSVSVPRSAHGVWDSARSSC